MKTISHYQLHQSVAVSGQYTFYSATDLHDQQKCIIKTVSTNAKDTDRAQLLHEYYLLMRLSHYDHFPKTQAFDDTIPGIVFVDEGLQRLSTLYSGKKMALDIFLPFAIVAARALAEIHQEHIIHKDISSQTILYHSGTGDLHITGFAIASELLRTMVPGDPPRLLQGQLAYMSPEQTGRTNRPLSARSDLYSLGVVFYELLLGHLPFEITDPMSLIIHHLNVVPRSPYECDKNIPETLSKIVMKLLEKKAEDRYKSALGLADDLELAWIEFKDKRIIADFPLGKKDVAMQLQLPEKLYGREAETQKLLNAFNTMLATHKTSLLTVRGYSGIGKSSLVNELAKSITLSESFFASGKFDKFKQSDSYQGLRDALDKLVQYQFNLPEADYLDFKNNVITELGAILPLMADFIPSLKNIVGEQAPLPQVGIEETKNRFQLAMLRLFKAITKVHPLVLFLDDLQWANTALLEILEKLLLARDINNLFVIVSYRSNEVDEHHPLSVMLAAISQKMALLAINLEGINEQASSELLQDMLCLPAHEVSTLNTMLSKKAEGNPFFLLMVLDELYKEELLYFSKERQRWVWNEAEIISIAATENVVAFVERRLIKLPEETKTILHLAACVGGTFSLESLSYIQLGDAVFLAESLKPAMKADLIIPLSLHDEWNEGLKEAVLLKRHYRFQHDRIQQSAYQLRSLEETKQIQLKLARAWYQAYKEDLSEKKLLAVVDQFNKGLTYVSTPEETILIGKLNYDASQFALQSIAYDLAYEYAAIAKQLLADNEWSINYEFTFNVYFNYVKCSFLTHHYAESNAASEIALEKASSTFDKAKILALKGHLDRVIGKKFDLDNNYFAQGLSLLGYGKIAKKPHLIDIILAVLRYHYTLRFHYQPLAENKTTSSRKETLLFELSFSLVEESYYAGDLMRYVYCLLTWCISTYANQEKSLRAIVYGTYGILWPYSQFGHRLYLEGHYAIQDDNANEQTAAFSFGGTVLHLPWHAPWSSVITALKRSIDICERVGNLELLGYSLLNKMLYKNESCQEALHYYENLSSFVSDISARVSIVIKLFRQYYFVLTHDYDAFSWQNDLFDATVIEKITEESHYSVGLNVLINYRANSYIHFNRKELFSKAFDDLYSKFNSIVNFHNAYDIIKACMTITILAVENYSEMRLYQKISAQLLLRKVERLLKKWRKLCPENFNHIYSAVQAERARLKSKPEKALALYDKASEQAIANGSWEYAALANHRALALCVAQNKAALATVYAKLTLRYYENWQATAVVEYIKKEYAYQLSV